jgi:iron complex outermembrane receptor protein
VVFRPDALFSIAIFDKEIESFPQTSSATAPCPRSSTRPASRAASRVRGHHRRSRHDRGQPPGPEPGRLHQRRPPFAIRQFRDAPGGYIRGVELNYQQNLTFLPWYFENLGIQANYTHLESELNYILTPPAVWSPAWVRSPAPRRTPSTSRSSTKCRKFSARVSTAYRAEYVTQYPIASGT